MNRSSAQTSGQSSLELEDAIRREVLGSRSMGRVSVRDVNRRIPVTCRERTLRNSRNLTVRIFVCGRTSGMKRIVMYPMLGRLWTIV